MSDVRDDKNIHLKMSLLLLNRKEEFELGRQLLLRIQAIGEVYATDAAVRMDLHAQCLYIVSAVGASGEVGEVELDLIPAFVETHRHCADEWLDASGRLVVGCAEATSYIFVVEHLHFEGEVFLELRERGCTFLIIMTRKGSLMPSVFFGSAGHVMKLVETLVPMISRTDD
jgi:hypothetical protein